MYVNYIIICGRILRPQDKKNTIIELFMSEEIAVTNTGTVVTDRSIENMIYTVRGIQIIMDQDLAKLYGVDTKRLNEQVKRNKSRFPGDFMFRLTTEEFRILKSQNATSSWGGRRYAPNVFTELGVSMLSSVLTSDVAIQANVQIMRAFAAMRRFFVSNAQVFHRLDNLEFKLSETDQKVERLYVKLEEGKLEPRQGVFFDGQIFDAYSFLCGIIKQATREIILFDNYIDETVLTLLDKRGSDVSATIYTRQISRQLQLDLSRHNAQYAPIGIKPFNKAHDRFLIIDEKVYHIGASLKDIGKRWFAFSLMNDISPLDLKNKT